jgi:CubicO group peptidase (beta-lactamase class C family)
MSSLSDLADPVMSSRHLSAISRLAIIAVLLLAGALPAQAKAPRSGLPSAADARAIDRLVKRHGIVTAGMGVIRDGALVWQHHAGEQSPGVPASSATRYNVASIAKTVTAETILRLVGQGRLSLDESMATYWVDPDLASDPRVRLLTPRMALNHTTGFPNWRFFLRGGKLAFQQTPGERYGYSGEGLDYVARYAERKLATPFPDLVDQTVFKPIGMSHSSIVVRRGDTETIARPIDESGVFHGHYCRPAGKAACRAEGSYAAADDMVTTVGDYAAFLRAVVDAKGYGPAVAAERDRVQTDKGAQRVVDCAAVPIVPCPQAQGYGLGFNVLRYGDVIILEHGGADWSELAVAYIAKPSRSGVIVFLNAPNRRALAAMPEILGRIDPGSPFLQEYRRWLAEDQAQETKAAETPKP